MKRIISQLLLWLMTKVTISSRNGRWIKSTTDDLISNKTFFCTYSYIVFLKKTFNRVKVQKLRNPKLPKCQNQGWTTFQLKIRLSQKLKMRLMVAFLCLPYIYYQYVFREVLLYIYNIVTLFDLSNEM